MGPREHADWARKIRYRLSLASVQRRLELLDEAIEEVVPIPGKDDVYFYYRFRPGTPRAQPSGRWLMTRSKDASAGKTCSPISPVLAQVKDPEQYPEVTRVGRESSQAFIQSPSGHSVAIHLRAIRSGQTCRRTRLLPDSSNLGLVLNQIEHSGDTRVNALLKEFFPRFERLSIRIWGGTVQLYLFESGFKAPIPATPPLRRARCVLSRCLPATLLTLTHHHSSASRSLNSVSTPMRWRY